MPCKVRSGLFSDERRVLVDAGDNRWFGFVDCRWLKNKVEEGEDEILAKVVLVEGDTFQARMPGDAPRSSLFVGSTDRLVPQPDSVQA